MTAHIAAGRIDDRFLLAMPPPSAFERAVTALLTHPLTLRLKRLVLDIVWRRRGRDLRNPPLPPAVRRLLFVCKGNICRSPFAEHLAISRFRAAGRPDIVSVSAGFVAREHDLAPEFARTAARDFELDLSTHRAQPLTKALFDAADLVIIMEAGQRAVLLDRFPNADRKIFLLPLFTPLGAVGAGYRRFNIADPYGKSLATFRECYREISVAIDGLIAAAGRPAARERASRPGLRESTRR